MKRFVKIGKFILLSFFILPIFSLFLWCCAKLWEFESYFPKRFSFKGFVYFFSSGDYQILLSTSFFSVAVALVSVLLAILAASGLIRLQFRISIWLEGVIYLPMMLPIIGICIGIHKLFLTVSDYSTLNIFLMHVYFSLPYAFLVIYAAYKENGRKWVFVSKNLGISDFQTLLYVEIPLIKDYLYSAFLFAFSVSFGQYFINMFLGGYKDVNFSMVIAPYLQTSDRNIGAVYIFMYLLAGLFVMLVVRKGLKIWKT